MLKVSYPLFLYSIAQAFKSNINYIRVFNKTNKKTMNILSPRKFRFILLLLICLVSCNDNNNDQGYDKASNYLNSITAEYHLTKAELISEIVESFPAIKPLSFLLEIYAKDIEVVHVIYNTTGVDGKPTVASGVITFPSGITEYDCLTSLQHGTIDMEEAPSSVPFHIEMIPVIRGKVIVMADYLGYGVSQTIDRQHPYCHSKLTGTACADLIEAAREYFREKEIKEVSDNIELIGYSQGGSATISTLLELDQRNESTRVKSVLAGGGSYDLYNTALYFLRDEFSAYPRMGYVPYLLRGMIYGEQLPIAEHSLFLSDIYNSKLAVMFSTRPLSEWHQQLGRNVSEILHPDFLDSPHFNGNSDIISVMDAIKKNSLIDINLPDVPIQLFHAPEDNFVPYSNSATAHKVWKNTTLTDLTATDHVTGYIEFIMRYMGLWPEARNYMNM